MTFRQCCACEDEAEIQARWKRSAPSRMTLWFWFCQLHFAFYKDQLVRKDGEP